MNFAKILMIMVMVMTTQLVKSQNTDQTALKRSALVILETKCNVCHLTMNRKRVFTESNMQSYIQSIYKQVYIKRRMPKGRKITLTRDEEAKLLKWINASQ